jgi:hypothetical protein
MTMILPAMTSWASRTKNPPLSDLVLPPFEDRKPSRNRQRRRRPRSTLATSIDHYYSDCRFDYNRLARTKQQEE